MEKFTVKKASKPTLKKKKKKIIFRRFIPLTILLHQTMQFERKD